MYSDGVDSIAVEVPHDAMQTPAGVGRHAVERAIARGLGGGQRLLRPRSSLCVRLLQSGATQQVLLVQCASHEPGHGQRPSLNPRTTRPSTLLQNVDMRDGLFDRYLGVPAQVKTQLLRRPPLTLGYFAIRVYHMSQQRLLRTDKRNSGSRVPNHRNHLHPSSPLRVALRHQTV